MPKRAVRHTCASCDAKLDVPSWHCDRCVAEKRVCRMCAQPLTGKQEFYHSPACKVAYDRNSKKQNGNVTDVTVGAGAILAALSDLSIQLAQVKEGLGTEIQGVKNDIRDIQVTTVTTVRTTSARQSDDDLDALIQEVELTEEEKAERGRQATQNFLTSLAAMAATKPVERGPKKMDVPQFDVPDFDDLLDETGNI